MKGFRRFFAEGRVREARARLARDPSPLSYGELAQEHARLGQMREALEVCEEGLKSFPGSPELARSADRARRGLREDRLVALKRELLSAPRPGLWRELAELYLESGQPARAEECAQKWFRTSGDGEAQLVLARVRVEQFLADRGREAGLRAVEALDEAQRRLPRDARPLQLKLDLCLRVGARADALSCAAALLELSPGEPAAEARYRALQQDAGQPSPSLAQALRDVEKSGRLVDDGQPEKAPAAAARDLRPALQRLAADPKVHAALYVRGSTALVQGPKGVTAERTARAARALSSSARSLARRMGLGRLEALSIEGEFGTLWMATGEMDAGALWCSGAPSAAQKQALLAMAGSDTTVAEERS